MIKKEKIASYAAACLGCREIGSITMDVKDHVTGMEANDGVGVGSTIIEEVL